MSTSPTLADRLDRLFDFFRNAGEERLSFEAAATVIGQRLDRRVEPAVFAGVIAGEVSTMPEDVARELCQLMNVPAFYLSPHPEDASVVAAQHQTLHLWCLIRDRGVHSLIARNTADAHAQQHAALIEALSALPVATPAAHPHRLEVVR